MVNPETPYTDLLTKTQARLANVETRLDALEKLERKRAAKKLKRKSKTKTKR